MSEDGYDDDMSSLSTLSELSEDDCEGELLEVVTDARRVSRAAAVLKGDDKRDLRKLTRVPHPKTALLRPGVRNPKLCKSKLNKRLIDQVNHDLEHWAKKAPVYRLAGVSLEDLQTRTKNAPKDKALAQKIMDEMRTWESDGASGIFEDELGNTLVAYFGRRVDAEVESGGLSEDPAQSEGRRVYSDGIKTQTLDKGLVATQLLVHHTNVEHANRDGRHDKEDFLMKYAKDGGPPGDTVTQPDDRQSFALKGVEYVYQDSTFTSELAGVLHLVHGWPDQAHDPEKYGIHPSKNMVSGAHGAPQVHAYFKATETLALRQFDAGKWTVVDPGPFLGRVIVWKLSVGPHQDGLDEGPAVIFPMGRFEGGECYLPDLKLKLS
ncbi:uncharacterized protein EDB91DRAFT_1256291 [Suillus paluster]|uniref:uncharacterized protein n=1 Tax=Suillus paluster TaxID=48578 RepID=UPI001B86FFCF|nr:uncharacterized protein EDB91DRAFT_1256291 [Suillus paluster]KAG1721947.1 hypothetical protein EDB91DRAFT_1256291 [Suillus paluster]